MQAILERPMTKKEPDLTMSVRVDKDALEAAKIAAAYKGVSVMEYASALLREAANRDIEESHRSRSVAMQSRKKRPKGGDE
jgi:hypothetical protein